MPTRSTPALDTMRTITGVGDSERSMFPETTACAAAAPESNGRTSTSTPCFLKKPSSLATYATSPENTGGTPGTAMETRSAASAGPAASANSTNGSAWLLVVGVIPGPPDRPTVELQYARIAASGTTTPDRCCRHPHHRRNAGPDPVGDGPGERRDEHHHQRLRGQQQAGARGTQAAAFDQVEVNQEEDAVHANVVDDRAGGGAGEGGPGEQREVEHRPRDAPLDAQEDGKQRDRRSEEQKRRGRGPSPRVALVQPEEQREQTGEEGGRARPVEPLLDALRRVGDDVPGAEEQRHRPDRHVDVEDRAPAPVLREEAAQRRPHRQTEVRQRAGRGGGAVPQ